MEKSIWSHNPKKYLKECKRLRSLCLRILDDNKDLTNSAHRLSQFRFWLHQQENSDFDIFELIIQKTNHLPGDKDIGLWEPNILKIKLKEREEIESKFRKDFLKSVQSIYEKYDKIVRES